VTEAGSRYGASDSDIASIRSSITGLGLAFDLDPTRIFARVSGTADAWKKALGGPLKVTAATSSSPFVTYQLPSELPGALTPSGSAFVLGIAQTYDAAADGSRPSTGARPSSGPSAQATAGTAAAAATLPWPVDEGTPYSADCTAPVLAQRYVNTPAQVRTAYGLDELAAPSKQPVVTVLDLGGGWLSSDLAAAAACFGFAAPTVVQHQGDGVPTAIANADDETSLDLQTVSAAVPDARVTLVQTTDGGGSMLDGFARTLDQDPLPDVVSVSYGACAIADRADAPAYVKAVDAVLQVATLAGVGVYVAAGDSGSTTCGSQVTGPSLSYPAVSAFVTAVGGTRITLGAANALKDEVVWNDAVYGERAAGGGGVSVSVPRPWYQDGVVAGRFREVPDVAALAAIVPGWPVVVSGALTTVGGTSGASPFTAAAAALVGAIERSAGRPAIGLGAPWFYRAATTSGAFRDVTAGSNDLAGVGCCTARAGYDKASGLGSPVWNVLVTTVPKPA
jgi:subtilase family serine protease